MLEYGLTELLEYTVMDYKICLGCAHIWFYFEISGLDNRTKLVVRLTPFIPGQLDRDVPMLPDLYYYFSG